MSNPKVTIKIVIDKLGNVLSTEVITNSVVAAVAAAKYVRNELHGNN